MKVLFFILLIVSASSQAIIIRHDVADLNYRQLAEKDNSTVTFIGAYKGKDIVVGTGSIISDRWIVTAAHVANQLSSNEKVQFKDSFYQIEKIIRHPLWKDQQFPNDIALVKLVSVIENATVAKLYHSSKEVGQIARFVGRGDFGTGATGVAGADKALRAAHNLVSAVQEQWLQFVFDSGKDALSLEGISGPGDSGGPAYIYPAGSVCLIGVSAWQNAESTGWAEGRYGVVENYSRISHFRSWIEQTMVKESSVSPQVCPESES